jgi:hypothetical protein
MGGCVLLLVVIKRCIDPASAEWKQHKKHFFVLSSAGKPIYSRYGDENQLSTFTGVIQAIISFYQDNDDTIRSIHTDTERIIFLLRPPLYFVVVSRTEESDSAVGFCSMQYVPS